MWKSRTYGYLGQGYSMSRRARIAVLHHEYPISHFIDKFGLCESMCESMLIYMGSHHTDSYFELTKFYRLPDKDDPAELMNIYDAFHLISADRVRFITIMSQHLQKCIDEKNNTLPNDQRPRKRRRRKRIPHGKRRLGRWSRNSLNRRMWPGRN